MSDLKLVKNEHTLGRECLRCRILGHKFQYLDLPLHIERICVRCGLHDLMCYEEIDDPDD